MSVDTGEVYRAGRPALGARLLAAAQMVQKGRAVADIGCDHGKLAVWLALGGAPSVVAVDNRPMPLAKAQALVKQCGCEAVVRCVLASGLEAPGAAEADEIVIAGLGGEAAAGIIMGCEKVRDVGKHFVLVPASRHGHLRRSLCSAGFSIEAERPVLERGRAYTVMSVRYTGKVCEAGALFCEVGRIPFAPPQDAAAAKGYIMARLANLEKRGRAHMDEAARCAHNKLTEEVKRCLL